MSTARDSAAERYCLDHPIDHDPHRRCVIAKLPDGLTWQDIAAARRRIQDRKDTQEQPHGRPRTQG